MTSTSSRFIDGESSFCVQRVSPVPLPNTTMQCLQKDDIFVWFYQDFTIDGRALEDANQINYEEAYRNKLIYATGKLENAKWCHSPHL